MNEGGVFWAGGISEKGSCEVLSGPEAKGGKPSVKDVDDANEGELLLAGGVGVNE